MSGYASYDDALDPKYGDPYPVPMVTASRDTLRGYGTIVTDFKSTKVEITPWPVKGRRFFLRWCIHQARRLQIVSCSTQLSMKFIMLINFKMSTVDILTFMSLINTTS